MGWIVGFIAGLGILGHMEQTSGFIEEFTESRLHARWEWQTPVQGPQARLEAGALVLETPVKEGGFNHWTNAADAPMLTTKTPLGDWDFEGSLRVKSADPAGEYHAGLVVGFTPKQVVVWGPFQSKRFAGSDQPELWLERTGEARLARVPMPEGMLRLKIEKRGDVYQFWVKEALESPWRSAGRIISLMPPRFVGVISKTFAEGLSRPLQLEVERLALTPVETERRLNQWTVPLKVDSSTPPVSAHIYGHFIEHLGRCIQGGIWAELLTNRKFAGNPQTNGVIESWQPIGTARFSSEHTQIYTGGQAQKIELSGGRAGIAQGGFALRSDCDYEAKLVFWSDGIARLSLRLNGAEASTHEFKTGWQTFEARLKPTDFKEAGRFEIIAEGTGALIIGCASLMPGDHQSGFRRDVIETVKSCAPPNLRWPGGNFVSGYDWHEGIGERDKRPPRWDRAWGAWDMNDVGTDEFIQFCRLIQTEPYICVNAGEGTPRMAAEWVEYCNGSAETLMGRLRAQNGHPEPYRVRYWGTGNEMYGDWQLGHLDPVKYGLKAVEFAKSMRAVDPDILLILVGVEEDGWGDWNRKALRIAGSHHDYLSVHFYQGADAKADPLETYHRVVTASSHVERLLARTAAIIREVMPTQPLPIAFDEWNTWYANAVVQNGLEQEPPLCDGLFAAGVFHAMIRLSDRVTMANLAQLVNVLGALRVDPTQVLKTPTYLAFEMYAPHFVGHRQSIQLPEEAQGFLDIAAVWQPDKKQLAIGIINRSLSETHTVKFELQAWEPSQKVNLMRMQAERFDAVNTMKTPHAVKIVRESVDWRAEWQFPPHSVTVLLLSDSK